MAARRNRKAKDDTAVAARRAIVAERYLRGDFQSAIAKALRVNQGTISRDLEALRQQWRESALQDFDARKAQELAKLDETERAAWQGWERSLRDAEKTVTRNNDDGTETTTTIEGQAGDPRFLNVVVSCVERRAELLDLNPAKKTILQDVSALSGPLNVTIELHTKAKEGDGDSAQGVPPASSAP